MTFWPALNTPNFRLAIFFIFGLCMLALATMTAANQPALGLTFQLSAQTQVTLGAQSGNLTLTPLDLTPEPGELSHNDQVALFFERQDALASYLNEREVSVDINGQRQTVVPTPRGVERLPPLFWVQIAVGFGALIISGWVWALRPHDLASRLFALSGLSTLTFTLAAAVYTTRELALPAPLFKFLVAANTVGASVFGIAMICLFVIYPTTLARWRGIAVGTATFFGGWTILSVLGQLPGWAGVNLITVVEMACICIAIGTQFVAARSHPEASAILTWFGLSVLIGAGAFILLVAAPLVFGSGATIDQGYAFLFFLIIYLGLAAGLRRYRLFDLGDWAFRTLFYLAGTMLLIGLDAILVLVMSLEHIQAFGISLVATAVLYLPLRDMFTRRFMRRGQGHGKALFAQVVDVALTPRDHSQSERWQELLKTVFDPLHVQLITGAVDSGLKDNGLRLTLPAIGTIPACQLEFAYGGRKLFSSRDLILAEELAAMLYHSIESRHAYETGGAEERARIARDIHDNIGAQLLGALHSKTAERKDTLIRETLSDLRDIINNAARPSLSFIETLADLRSETAERLAGAGVQLNWIITDTEFPSLTPHAVHALRSVIREAASNVMRHAQAKNLDINIQYLQGKLIMTIEDDGTGSTPQASSAGNGLINMKSRITSLGGTLEAAGTKKGFRLIAEFPLV